MAKVEIRISQFTARDDVNSDGPTFVIAAQAAQHMAVQEEARWHHAA
jgi:hypothetical protein